MINSIFEAVISMIAAFFGPAAAVTVGNGIGFALIGAVAVIFKLLGVM